MLNSACSTTRRLLFKFRRFLQELDSALSPSGRVGARAPAMPPPADFEILRAQEARRGAGGETKEELLRRASAERTSRANERRRKHGALTVQRMWRGCASRARSRAATLARWDERYGDARTSPTPAELFDALMPPLHSVGAARAGATRTLRALALALGTLPHGAAETRACVLREFPAKTRRLQNFALDALAANVSDDSGDVSVAVDANSDTAFGNAAMEKEKKIEATREQRRATRECATRLLASTHDAADGFSAFFHFSGQRAEGDDTRATSATHETSLLASIHAASAYHARVCDVAASLIRAENNKRDDPSCAKTLVRIATDFRCVFPSVGAEKNKNGAPSENSAVPVEDADVRFSARAATNVAARLFGAKETALHLVAQTAWFSRLVATSALESFLAAFRVVARDARVPFDPVAAANNLVWLVTGWHPPSGLDPAPSAKAARARLASLPRSTACAFVETLERVLAVTPDGEIASSTHTEASRYARVPALREAWFVAGVAREGDDASLDATARLYWRACREEETDAGAPSSSNRDSDDTKTSAAVSRRRRLLGALAFAPGTTRRLWLRCASRVSAAVSLGADEQSLKNARENEESGTEQDLWTCPASALGVASMDAAVLPTVGAFALAYAHLLEVVDDDEFHDARTAYSFTSGERNAVAAFANTLVVRERLRLITGTKENDVEKNASFVDRAACVDACASLLQSLVTRDERRRFAPDGLWLAPARALLSGSVSFFPSVLPPEAAAAALFGASDDGTSGKKNDGFAAFLQDCPHALPFETRVEIFRALVALDRARLGFGAQAGGVDADRATQGQRVPPVCSFRVRRDHVLEDTLAALLPLGSRLKGRIAVTFVNAAGAEEAGVDAGGLFKELMETSLNELVDPRRGLWSYSSEESSTSSGRSSLASMYPAARAGDDPESAALLELAGLLFGKALYEGVLHTFRLAPFFAKKLSRRPLSLDDLPSLDGALHRSLKQVMRYEGDVRDLCLDWYAREEVFGAVVARKLRPGDEKTPDDVVESHETLAWAHATAEFHLVRRRHRADAAFQSGLFKMIHPSWLRLFGANELGALMTGDADGDVDVDDLRRHCAFGGGYGETSRTVLMFWECVSSFTREERRALLKFVTSSAAPPLGGFQHLHPPFTIYKVRCDLNRGGLLGNALATFGLARDVDRLPTASTCFNVLKLPNFKRLDTMKAKLRTAIQAGAGFELS